MKVSFLLAGITTTMPTSITTKNAGKYIKLWNEKCCYFPYNLFKYFIETIRTFIFYMYYVFCENFKSIPYVEKKKDILSDIGIKILRNSIEILKKLFLS